MKMKKITQIELIIPANHKYLNIISATLDAIFERDEMLSGEKGDTLYEIQLGVHEACTNIVDHAYKGVKDGIIYITFEIWSEPARLIVDIRDTGESFNPDQIPSPDFGGLQIRGFGLHLVHQLMDGVIYYSEMDGNHWCLTKHFRSKLITG